MKSHSWEQQERMVEANQVGVAERPRQEEWSLPQQQEIVMLLLLES